MHEKYKFAHVFFLTNFFLEQRKLQIYKSKYILAIFALKASQRSSYDVVNLFVTSSLSFEKYFFIGSKHNQEKIRPQIKGITFHTIYGYNF